MLFVEALDGEAEMELVGGRFDHPLLINITGGLTPVLPAERLREMGYTIAIYPGAAFGAAAKAAMGDLRIPESRRLDA